MVLLLIRAGADHSPDGGSGADGPAGHPPDGADGPDGSKQTENWTSDQMIRMVLVSLIKLTKLISNKLRC